MIAIACFVLCVGFHVFPQGFILLVLDELALVGHHPKT